MKYPFMSSSTEVYSDYHVFITQFALGEGIVCLSTLKYFLFDFRGKFCTIYMPSILIIDKNWDIINKAISYRLITKICDWAKMLKWA